MKKTVFYLASLGLAAVFFLDYSPLIGPADPGRRIDAGQPGVSSANKTERPYGISKRVPWTTARVKGSPEPPHPYKVERAFPRLSFKNPLLMAMPPGGTRFFVGEQAGKIYSFPNDPACSHADLFIDVAKLESWDKSKVKGIDALYGLAFHPQFAKNRYCYICYVLNGRTREPLADGSRVSRFRVSDTDPPRCDPASEKVIITWLAGGHNGGDLHFGPDGYLYISTGDAANPNPPDRLDTGQDISDLLSSILRIDVDREGKRPYAVPADNPFIKTPNARPEVWSYGFRNPWRMSFDRATGDLWVGDVGWELWEMIYRVKRGGNYGWSVMEGPQPVRPQSKRGPTPILPPALAFPHTEAASITGGYVYRGRRLKDLEGAYICGDWVTRKLWGTRFDGDKIVWHKELAQSTERVVAFGEDQDKELYFLHYDDKGTIHRLVPNEAARDYRDTFPRTLSQTGLFASVKDHVPAPGVIPFAINAEQWTDHATAERFVALPGNTTAKLYDHPIAIRDGGFYSGQVFFPRDGVLTKTISLEMEAGNPRSRRRLETQILHFDGTLWQPYTFAWNDDQTDARLVPAAGSERAVTVVDPKAPGGRRLQTWHFHSRAQCLTCHNPWSGYALAFNPLQLNRDWNYAGIVDNQLRTLRHIGLVSLFHHDEDSNKTEAVNELAPVRLFDPHDPKVNVNERTRSYLHVNCAHCHQFGAGGTAMIDLRYATRLERTNALEARPVQGTFDINPGQILSPGDPYSSILYYRMAKLGPGRMPHIGSDIVDQRGLRLLHDWIRQLPIRKDERALIEKLRALDETPILARERAERESQLQRLARDIARKHDRKVPGPEDRKQAESKLALMTAAKAKARAAERAAVISKLLSSTTSALMLAGAIEEKRIPASIRPEVLSAAMALAGSPVRDLFERFIPDDQRVKRLGSIIKPESILSLKGNVDRGRELFFKAAGLQCAGCHRVGTAGSTLGPDLSEIGKKYSRAQILESILDPSKFIDPKYASYLVETTDGKVLTGILASRTEREIVLRVVPDKEVSVKTGDVALMQAQQKSLMPDLLLRDVTAEQAADLVDYLASLK